MGVGLMLKGRRPKPGVFAGRTKPGEWLSAVENWARVACAPNLISVKRGQNAKGVPQTALLLHPLSASVRITELPDSMVEVESQTNVTGPGYHEYVCELIDRISRELLVSWNQSTEGEFYDETGYFERRNRAKLEHEMLAWVSSVAKVILERNAETGGDRHWSISADLDQPGFEHDGFAWTPMGPRSKEWIEQVAADETQGKDLFPWWDPGFGASYYLGRAVSIMWTEVRWRIPMTHEDRSRLENVFGLLKSGLDIDPGLEYPWHEWAEIATFLGWEDQLPQVVARRAQDPVTKPLVGYRRRPVRARLAGGWSIRVPGDFGESWTDDGNWEGFDEDRTINVSILAKPGTPTKSPEEVLDGTMPKGPDVHEHADGRALSRAVFKPDSEGNLCLEGLTVSGNSVASSWFTLSDDSDREWALSIWRSIQPPSPGRG